MSVRSASVLIAAVLTLVFGACAPDVVFIGDPALRATVDAERFEATMEEAITGVGRRSRVLWPEADSLGALDPEAAVAATEVQAIGLSPYLSLFAASIAERFPERTFVAFSRGPDAPNLSRVRFDASAALREAGELLAGWVFDASSRSAALLVDESRPGLADEARALAEGYRAVAAVDLTTHAFAGSPTREELRARLDALPAAGEVALVVLLGERTGTLLEIARDEELLLGGRNLGGRADGERVLFTVRDDLALGLAEALESPGPSLVVPAVLEASAAMRPVE